MAKRKRAAATKSAAATWKSKAARIHTKTLSSGVTIKYRNINVLALAKAGIIPKALIPAAVRSVTNPTSMNGDQWLQAFEVNQRMACAALIEPVVVMTPEEIDEDDSENTICVEDIPSEDLSEIANTLLTQADAEADPTAG